MSAALTETPDRIEPCLVDAYPAALTDLIAEVVSASASLGLRLHPRSAATLAELVRVMNCYYSNLIEGHDTRPRDIERALADDLEANAARRDLQLEARAHIRVQREVDRLSAAGEYGEPASTDRIRWLHRSFYDEAPARMLRIEHPAGAFNMVPGQFRGDAKHDVTVGRHQPPSCDAISAFMTYFEERFRFDRLRTAARVFATASAHHRFNYIHPFSDGNGRVSRLMSHAMAAQAGIGAHGLWSISRGLARGLSDPSEYKQMLDDADSPRRGDADGRGNLSERALIDFVTWFCNVALDQIRFMTSLFELDRLDERLQRHVEQTLALPKAASQICSAVLRRGEIPRGEAASIAGRSERSGRALLAKLVETGLLASETPKGAVRLHFSIDTADQLFPRLFPAQV